MDVNNIRTNAPAETSEAITDFNSSSQIFIGFTWNDQICTQTDQPDDDRPADAQALNVHL